MREIAEMERKPLKALIACPKDKEGKLATTIQSVYHDLCGFSGVEFTTTLRKTINSLQEDDFDICFIANSFDLDDVRAFFVDYGSLQHVGACGFVQVHPELKPETDIVGAQTLGFHAVVSEKGTHEDKETLQEAMEEFIFEAEIVRRKIDVDSALNVVLRKIDDAARNLKRGMKSPIDALPAEFIEIQTEFDQEILQAYYSKLETKTFEAEPENATELDVPEEILGKDLPKLEKNKYIGASNRVWKKLLRKHGIQTGEDGGPVTFTEELDEGTNELGENPPLPESPEEEILSEERAEQAE